MPSMVKAFLIAFVVIIFLTEPAGSKKRRQVITYPATSTAVQTRSLSGTYATDGSNDTNKQVYDLITLLLFKGFAIFRVKEYNDRVYLEKYRRSYWFGDRYYALDNRYYLATRDTCAYNMTYEERKNLLYTDGTQIFDIVYQCQRYVEYCCGLNCCRNWDLVHSPPSPRPMQYPWSNSAYSIVAIPACVVLVSYFR